jgi:hypothetical protein
MLHKRREDFCGVSDLVPRADAMMRAVGDVPDPAWMARFRWNSKVLSRSCDYAVIRWLMAFVIRYNGALSWVSWIVNLTYGKSSITLSQCCLLYDPTSVSIQMRCRGENLASRCNVFCLLLVLHQTLDCCIPGAGYLAARVSTWI